MAMASRIIVMLRLLVPAAVEEWAELLEWAVKQVPVVLAVKLAAVVLAVLAVWAVWVVLAARQAVVVKVEWSTLAVWAALLVAVVMVRAMVRFRMMADAIVPRSRPRMVLLGQPCSLDSVLLLLVFAVVANPAFVRNRGGMR